MPPGQVESGLDAELRDVLVTHGQRGLRVQFVLRGVLVAFAAITAFAVPPEQHRSWLYAVGAAYALFAAATGVWLFTDGVRALRLGWVALFGDVIALVVLTLIAGESAVQSWTADLVINGFFVVPVLAATQLRPGVCLSVVLPTDVAYLGSSLATKGANGEPLGSILTRSVAVAAVSAGCVALCYIQRSRVRTIGSLLGDREQLLGDLLVIERQERQRLSEQLHDGALQYVLAARMDLDDLRDGTDPEAVERVHAALTQTSTLLRTTVGELYPAVLEQAALPDALRQVAAAAAERGAFAVSVHDDEWPAGVRTSADALLLRTAQELLANVVKHAAARTVRISVSLVGGWARLLIEDDGRGVAVGELDDKLRGGHIGVASHRARVHAAGGRLTYSAPAGTGTVVTVEVPSASSATRSS